jgi:DNA-binding CsgD family transcriptional regulator
MPKKSHKQVLMLYKTKEKTVVRGRSLAMTDPDRPVPRARMTWSPGLGIRLARWLFFVLLQGMCAVFFIGDVMTEIYFGGLFSHTILEGLATVALVFGVVFGGFEIWRISREATRTGENLRRARSEFSELVDQKFAEWSLSAAEADVALLQLKGFDVAEIAELRETAQGTVRAQLSHIYEKSGHPNRGRFVSSFVDVLIESPEARVVPR